MTIEYTILLESYSHFKCSNHFCLEHFVLERLLDIEIFVW